MTNERRIQLPGTSETSAGLYVAFKPTSERIASGARITTCKRCGKLVGHRPLDSVGHEIICLGCANDVPTIRRHLDELAKARGE
jgi:hypothetical protein